MLMRFNELVTFASIFSTTYESNTISSKRILLSVRALGTARINRPLKIPMVATGNNPLHTAVTEVPSLPLRQPLPLALPVHQEQVVLGLLARIMPLSMLSTTEAKTHTRRMAATKIM